MIVRCDGTRQYARTGINYMRFWVPVVLAGGLCLCVARAQSNGSNIDVSSPLKHDVSPPLRTIPPMPDLRPPRELSLGRVHPNGPVSTSPDSAIQSTAGPLIGVTAGLNFLGLGNGFVGPAGSFIVNSAPSDSNGAVGATQFVEWVNASFAVFDKATGA